jgi:hypothetical protein
LLDNQGYPTGYIKEALAALDAEKPDTIGGMIIEKAKQAIEDENYELNTVWQELKEHLPDSRIEALGERVYERNRVVSAVLAEIERAALDAEKPAEENYMVLLDAIFDAITENGIMNHPTNGMFLTSESIDACLPIIQQYAETYHAERCAACKERK